LVHTKACSELPRKGECYGKGILEDVPKIVVEQINSSHETKSLQETLKIEAEELDSTIPFDVTKFKSCIHLCLEEAFYLVHYKHSLKVYMDDIENVLTVEDLWKQCCKRDKNFVHKYVVYQYYRNKGWVTKPGMKFGVHFLLYKDGPTYYHSSYGVVVKSVMSPAEVSWQFVISFVRVMESVKKGAIVCEVKADEKEATLIDLSTPSCICNLIVEETLIQRWVPKQDRN